MTQAQAINYLRDVRDQYENYPYPLRDPALERQEFYYTPQDALDAMNYYHFNGRRDFRQGFRVLSAGGGTGDAILMLAEQCRDFDAELIYLDMSEASMNVAKERAKVRGLANITWMHGSLLDAPALVEGKFDYIECGGVLHHLASPEAGLAALASLLKEDGVMGLLLYAKYGRQGVYQMQGLMKLLNQGESDMRRKIEVCREVWNQLRSYDHFRQVDQAFAIDLNTFGDIGMYDLFLHSQDVAYSVPELYDFLATAGLTPTHFFSQDPRGNKLYRPEAYLSDEHLQSILARLSLPEKQAAAELMHGKINKHIFYAAKAPTQLPSIFDPEVIPCFSMTLRKDFHANLAAMFETVPEGDEAVLQLQGRELRLVRTRHAPEIFRHMDGHTSLGDIFARIGKIPVLEALKAEFAEIFATFSHFDWMFLRHASSSPAVTVAEIQARLA